MPFFGPNLDRLRDNGDVAGLAALLSSKREDTRFEAALRLGELRDPRAVEPLIDALRDDADNVRHAAWSALLKIGAPALEPLRNAARDRDRGVQRQATATLELIESELRLAPPSSLASNAGRTGAVATQGQSDSSRGRDDAARVLTAFEQALGRESHILVEHPELIGQQLVNRLQWEVDSAPDLLEPALVRFARAASQPWVRSRTGARESTSLVRTFSPGGRSSVQACCFSPDGNALAGTHADAITLWETASGRRMATLKDTRGDDAMHCDFGVDGTSLIAGYGNGKVLVWNLAGGHGASVLKEAPGPLEAWDITYGCAASRSGQLFAATSLDRLTLWHAPTETWMGTTLIYSRAYEMGEQGSALGAPFRTSACAFSQDGSRVAAGGTLENEFRVWTINDPRSGRTLSPACALGGDFRGLCSCAFSPDVEHLVSGHGDGGIRVWDHRQGSLVRTLEGHEGPVGGVAFSPDGHRLVSASYDGTLRTWNTSDWSSDGVLRGHGGAVLSCAVSPDGQFILSGGGDATLKLWQVHDGQVRHD